MWSNLDEENTIRAEELITDCNRSSWQLRSANIVPLVKCKTGDLSARAVTLSNSISKILESLVFDIIITDDDTDEYQFGFQKGVSIALCKLTHVFKNTVDYYKRNGSHIFCCFIDF